MGIQSLVGECLKSLCCRLVLFKSGCLLRPKGMEFARIPCLRLSKNRFGGNARIGAGAGVTKKRGKSEKFYSIFFKKSREWRGHEPRCPDRIRTPEKPLAGHTARPAFPWGGKPRFFIGCTPIFRCSASSAFPEGANLRKLWFRALHEMRAIRHGPQTIF